MSNLLDDIQATINAAREATRSNAEYQLALLDGAQRWSGSDLKGAAKNWSGRYLQSRCKVLKRLNKHAPNGLQFAIRSGRLTAVLEDGTAVAMDSDGVWIATR